MGWLEKLETSSLGLKKRERVCVRVLVHVYVLWAVAAALPGRWAVLSTRALGRPPCRQDGLVPLDS